MNNLFLHIEFLLLHNNCVIVPGMGAFICEHCAAQIDIESGIINPPYRRIMFNQSVTVDDGLIANSYARKYNLSFDEARLAIAKEVNDIFSTLRIERKVICGNLGSIKLGYEDNLIFVPQSPAELLNRNLGFSNARLELRESFVEPQDCIDDSLTETGNTPAVSDFYNFRFKKSLTKIAAACILLAIVAVTVILNPIPYDNREQRASVVPVESIIPSKTANKIEKNATPVANDSIKDCIEESVPSHYLIVATFSSVKEAEKYAQNNTSSDFPLTAVSSRKLCRVAVASSDNIDSLRVKLNSREIRNRYPGAWIWSRN